MTLIGRKLYIFVLEDMGTGVTRTQFKVQVIKKKCSANLIHAQLSCKTSTVLPKNCDEALQTHFIAWETRRNMHRKNILQRDLLTLLAMAQEFIFECVYCSFSTLKVCKTPVRESSFVGTHQVLNILSYCIWEFPGNQQENVYPLFSVNNVFNKELMK